VGTMKYKLLAAIASAVLAGVAACGPAPTGGLGPAPSGRASSAGTTVPASGTPQAPTPPASGSVSPAGPVTLQAWFARGGKLFETSRTVPATRSVGKAAVNAVLAGPNAAEANAGLVSDVPAGTSLLGLNIAGGVATVDLSSSFGAPAAASAVSLRLAQVVYTLTQFSSVRSVHWRINGQDVTSVAGVPVTGPQTQAAYAGDLPPITVSSPVIGATVTSAVTVSGTADVFEAVVSIEILNASGKEIARTFTMASCGTGCRGTYSTSVAFSVAGTQKGTIEVFERSAKDGSPVHMQAIPVTLAP
jgi:immunoglobulin-like protein involved in spore germination/sporulation and spore germination protein